MPPRIFRPFEREAYTQAGVAVIARKLRIPVYRLALIRGCQNVWLPSLPRHDAWRLQFAADAALSLTRTEEYVTALLSGSVGHLILQEKSFGYRKPSTGRAQLKNRRLAEVRRGEGRLADHANYLIFMWLRQVDGGNVNATVTRLWENAETLLRRPGLRRQLERLAIRLWVKRELFEHEIDAILQGKA